jgi:polysaccharide export outer membrane protein
VQPLIHAVAQSTANAPIARRHRKAHNDMTSSPHTLIVLTTVLCCAPLGIAGAQQPATQTAPQRPQTAPTPARPATIATGLPVPTDYVIGPDDVLGILFWRDPDMTGDVTVRPDGMITLPLLNNIRAAGLTPEALKDIITKAAAKFIEDPNVTVVVRQINSRNVFITGSVTRPGPYPLSGQMTVLQLIAVAGGLTEFADKGGITIVRSEAGKTPQIFHFNFKDVSRGKNMQQNIILKPGDTVTVP